MNLIEIKNLEFKLGDRILFSNLNLTIKYGDKVVIYGKNGSGKSTFLSLLLNIDGNKQGIKFKPNLKVSYLFQNSNDQFIAPSVLEDVAFSLLAEGISKEQAEQKSLEILEKLEISHLKDNSIYYLSGGEKRLVAIAGAFVREADIYLLDEPFNELDDEKIDKVLNLLNKKSSFIIITHSKKEALKNTINYEFSNKGLLKKSGA